MPPQTPLTLEGLAAVLERHIEHTAEGFREVRGQIGALTTRIDNLTGRIEGLTGQVERLTGRVEGLTGQVEGLVGIIREQGLRITTLAEQQTEQQVQIRQILHRLEQFDARFEEHSRQINEHSVFIRQILDLLQQRSGNGGPDTPDRRPPSDRT
jgi:chromosome segregation ATPase